MTKNEPSLKDLMDTTNRQLKTSANIIEINTIAENFITSILNAEFASLWIFNKKTASLIRERDNNTTREISMLGQKGVLAKCFFTLSGDIYNYLSSEKDYAVDIDNPDKIKMKSKIIIPLIDGETFIGMATAYSSITKSKKFTKNDLEAFESIAPFLINIIYKMYPNIGKENHTTEIYVSQRLEELSHKIVKDVSKIQKIEKIAVTKIIPTKKNIVQDTSKEENKEILTFLSNTVHDIRTPANTLYGFLELLEEQIEDDRLLSYIANAKESALFINTLTTSILDRVANKEEKAQSKAIKINPTLFFADIAQTFSANMSNKEIAFNVYIDPLLPKEVILESVLLKRVMMNLIGNAYKFTPSHKTICLFINYNVSDSSITINIKDDGIGIPKEKQQEIFKAFSQVDDSTKINYGGTGLGLSISAQYVKELGGQLELISEVEQGSTFYFTIPLNITIKEGTFKKIKRKKLNINILKNTENSFTTKNIMQYAITMGVPIESIIEVESIVEIRKASHLICFQIQLTEEIIEFTQENNVALLVIEEIFLSLVNNPKKEHFSIVSQYEYYANTLHKFILGKEPFKILIADDDKINITLMQALLRETFAQIEVATDGEMALNMLKEASIDESPYKLIFLDEYMPKMEGSEVIQAFRNFEKEKKETPIYAISISGNEIKTEYFDSYIGKPFNKKLILETVKKVSNKK